jgi:hypothetical protein
MNELFDDGYVYLVAARIDGYVFEQDKAFFLGGLRTAKICAEEFKLKIMQVVIALTFPEYRSSHEEKDWVWTNGPVEDGPKDFCLSNAKLKATIHVSRRDFT